MNNSLNRAVIETIVRRAITNIQDSPERSIRNLIDMAQAFTEGRFQSLFFQTAQNMLANSGSAYYRLISDAAANVDTERLLQFGMNLGYNSCTYGAKRIRTLENQEHFNIPWSVTLTISGQHCEEMETVYRSVLEQGKNLGIYTWMIYALDNVDQILAMISEDTDCAFVLYCAPEEITDSVLDEAETLRHIMFAVQCTDGAESACSLLRSRHFLYSVFYIYGEQDAESILKNDFLCDIEGFRPVFTAFVPGSDCFSKTREKVYRYVCKTRKEQTYPTILWDPVNDSRFIDHIISEDCCLAGFDSNGYLYTFHDRLQSFHYNMFRQPLAAILKQAFPKSE